MDEGIDCGGTRGSSGSCVNAGSSEGRGVGDGGKCGVVRDEDTVDCRGARGSLGSCVNTGSSEV